MKIEHKEILQWVTGTIFIFTSILGYSYYKSNSPINMTETQANVVLGAFYQTELCFRTGLYERTEKSDLTDIVYRVKVSGIEDGNALKDGMLKRDVMEAYLEERISQGLKKLSQPEVEFGVKELCNGYVEKAANIKKQYK